MMVMALARGIVALLAVVVMVMVLVVVVVMLVMMLMLVVVIILVVVVMMLVLMVVLVMLIMVMLMLGLLELVLAAHLLEQLVAERHLLDGGEDGLAVQLVPRSRKDGGVGVLLAQHRGGGL